MKLVLPNTFQEFINSSKHPQVQFYSVTHFAKCELAMKWTIMFNFLVLLILLNAKWVWNAKDYDGWMKWRETFNYVVTILSTQVEALLF